MLLNKRRLLWKRKRTCENSYDKESVRSDEEEEEESEDEEEEEDEEKAITKPIILEPERDDVKLIPFGNLKKLIEDHCVCKGCSAQVVLSEETFGIATTVCLRCQPNSLTKTRRTTMVLCNI